MNTLLWWLGQNTITVAVMIPLVLLACRLFRHRPAVQHILWLIVLLRFVTPPIVAWPWSVEQLAAAIAPAPIAAWFNHGSVNRPPISDLDVAGIDKLPVDDRIDQQLALLPREANSAASEAAILAVDSHSNSGPSAQAIWIAIRLVCLMWLVGAVGSLAIQIRRVFRHARLVRHGSMAPASLTHEIDLVAARLGLKPPRALIARGILSPFVWFLGRLRLVWPELLASKAEIVRARGVIAHELAHVLRGDHWVAWLEFVAGIVWWWNPLFWYVRRRLRDTAEMACDALAIGTFPEQRRDYAELLLELSAGFKTGAPAHVLAVSAGTPYSFERRLSMILSDCVSGKLSSWGIMAAVGLALIALPGWSAGQQESPPAADAAAAGTAKEKEQKKEISSPADDQLLRDLIEQGKIEEAQARLQALRTKQAADKAISDGVFPAKWKEALLKELPATCIKGMPENATLSWKMCMSCHVVQSEQPATVEHKLLKRWVEENPKARVALDQRQLIEQGFQVIQQKNPSADDPQLGMENRLDNSTNGRPILGFRGNDLLYYAVILEGQGAMLEALTSDGGKVVWKSHFADSLAGKKNDDKWSLEESKDGKQVIVSWTRSDGRLNYYFDSRTGKILRQEIVENAKPDSSTNSSDANLRQRSLTRLLRSHGVAEAKVKELTATPAATGTVQVPAQADGGTAAQYKRRVSDHWKDLQKSAEAQQSAATEDLRRLQSLVATGNVSKVELEAAQKRLDELQAQVNQYRSLLSKTSQTQKSDVSDVSRSLYEYTYYPRAYYPPGQASTGTATSANSLSSFELGERFLRANADLKNARSRVARLVGTEGAVSQQERDESQVELERAEKTLQFLGAYIQDALKSVQAEKAIAEADMHRLEQLHKKGYIAASELDLAKAKIESLAARIKQLETLSGLTK